MSANKRGKPPTPAAQQPSETKAAQIQPAADPAPSGANTTGKILPKTAPQPATPRAKARTKAERERDIAQHEQERREALQRGDRAAAEAADLKIAQVMDEPKAVGDVVEEAAGILGTILGSLGGRRGAGKPPPKAPARPPAPPPPPSSPPPQPSVAQGGGRGVYSTAVKRYPRHKCELMKYKEMLCDGEKHHVTPDYTLRTGTARRKRDPQTRIPGAPAYEDGPAICVSKKEHQGIHGAVDEKIQAAAESNGTISAGKVKEIGAAEAAKKSGCNPKNIRKQLDRMMKTSDDTWLRGVKNSRKVTDDMTKILKPDRRK